MTYRCIRCDASFERYASACPACSREGTLRSEAAPAPIDDRPRAKIALPSTRRILRASLGLRTLDRAFGESGGDYGYPLEGTCILSGLPGAGKSSLALLIAQALIEHGVLYANTDCSESQFSYLVGRTGYGANLPVVHTSLVRHILREAEETRASFLFVDQLHSLEPRSKALDHLKEISRFCAATKRSLFVVAERALAGNVRGGLSSEYAVDIVVAIEKPKLLQEENAWGGPHSAFEGPPPANDTLEGQRRWLVFTKNRLGPEGRHPLLLGPHGWAEVPSAEDTVH